MSDHRIGRLSDLLARTIAQAKFVVETLEDTGLELTSQRHLRSSKTVVSTTEYDAPAFRKFSVDTGFNRKNIRARLVPYENQTEFDNSLRELTSDIEKLHVVHNQRIRHALPDIIEGPSSYTISAKGPNVSIGDSDIVDVAKFLLLQAALADPVTVSATFVGWTQGEGLSYETRALIGGIRIDDLICLEGGVRFEGLPLRASDLPGRLPRNAVISEADCLGRVLMIAECSVAPAISSPQDRPMPTLSWAFGNHTIQEFCAALSVVSDSEIQDMLIWEDYGRNSAFRTGSTLTTSFAPTWARSRKSDVLVGKQDVARALELLKQTKGRNNLLVAIDQWRKSKRYMANDVEQLICLRTALEALLLAGGSRSELKYRFSLHGAFLMGMNGTDRKKIFDDLGSFYNLSSTAVHDGQINHTERNRLTLAFAKHFCRKTILARAKGPPIVDWDSLILGTTPPQV